MPLAQTGNWRKTRSQIAVAVRQHPEADVTELRRQLKAERLAEHVKHVVDSAPLLTADQRARIAALLTSGEGSGHAA